MGKFKDAEKKVEDKLRHVVDHGEKSDRQKDLEKAQLAQAQDPTSQIPAQMRDVDHDAMPGAKPDRGPVDGINPAENADTVTGTLPGV